MIAVLQSLRESHPASQPRCRSDQRGRGRSQLDDVLMLFAGKKGCKPLPTLSPRYGSGEKGNEILLFHSILPNSTLNTSA